MVDMFLCSNNGPKMGHTSEADDDQRQSPSKRTSIDINRAADRLGIAKMNFEESWEEAFCSKFPSEVCGGYVGNWFFYTPEDEMTECIQSIRTYQVFKENGPGTVVLRNFYDKEPAGKKGKRRDIDGVYETVHERSLTDPYFSCSTRIFPCEEKEGLPKCSFWRAIPVEKDVLLRVALSLPPKPGQALSSMQLQYPSWSPHVIATASWAMEAFFEDGENRWSMGPLYNVQSLRLRSHFFIRERKTQVQREQPLTFSDQPSQTERGRLDQDPGQWVPGDWEGRMREIVWDSDGDMLQLRSRPTSWEPPASRSSYHSLFRYPDMMYACYPNRLTPPGKDPRAAFASASVRLEVGGMLRAQDEFRRLIVRYNHHTGACENVCLQVFKKQAKGGFTFDRMLSALQGVIP